MKPILTGVLASVAVLGLLSACSDDKLSTSSPTGSGSTGSGSAIDATLPSDLTIPPGGTLPPNITIPPGGTFPPDFSIPTAVIDQMVAQFEAAGLKVDRPCFENLLKDEDLRNVIASANTPSADVIQKFVACFKP